MSGSQAEAYLPLVLIVIVGYLLLVRPMRRRTRKAQELQASLLPGSDVMLTSGIFGRVVALEDDSAQIELAPGVSVKVHRGAISRVLDVPPADGTPAEDPPGPDAEPPSASDPDAGVN